jgi:DNA-binding IclR family transcriptional regulator
MKDKFHERTSPLSYDAAASVEPAASQAATFPCIRIGTQPMQIVPSVKSACRVFEILEHFKDKQEPLRLSDIAERLDYPVSSTSALLKTMLDQGYLQFDKISKRYFPSPRLAQLVGWIGKYNPERGPVLESMRRLQKRTSGLVVLGTPADLYIEYVESLRSLQPDYIYIPPGIHRLTVQNGMGWLFLSRMKEQAILSIYRRTMSAHLLEQHEFSLTALLERVEPLRNEDFVLAHAGEYLRPATHWSYAMLSMLVPAGSSRDRMAIGIAGPASRIDRDRDAILNELRKEMVRLANSC